MDRGQLMPDKPKRSKRAADLPNKVVPIHEGAEPLRASLDDTDLAIVRALQANARATYTEIGKAGVLSLVSVLPSDSMDAGATEAALATIPEIETAWSVAGEDSHLLVVRTRSIAQLSGVLQRLQAIDGVARTRTAVVLATPVRRPPTV